MRINKLRKKVLFSIIDILILQCIKGNSISGKGIINKIQGHFDVKISPNTIYHILSRLKKCDLVNIKIDKKRNLYFLTNNGKITSKALLKDYVNIQKKIGFFEPKE